MFCAINQVMTMPMVHSKNSGPNIHKMILLSRLPWPAWAARQNAGRRCVRAGAVAWAPLPVPARVRMSRGGVVAGVGFKAIPQTAYCCDSCSAGLDFSTQPIYIDFDGVRGHLFAPLTEQIHQLRLADQAATSRKEDFQQAGFARREVERLFVYTRHAGVQVENQLLVPYESACCAGAASCEGAYSSFEL